MPLSAIIAENLWWVCAALFTALRVPFFRRATREVTRTSWRDTTDWLLLQIAKLGFGVLPVIYLITKFPRSAGYTFFPPFVVLGPLVFLAGILVLYRAHCDLGRGFSGYLEIRQGHRLATSGIYAHIRHPMYLAYLLWATAQAMLLPNWVAGFSALATGGLFFAVRIPREEKMMLETFGDDYRAYMARTSRLVPGLL
jgi:protein-S-isoprenylcysteine O-methyltransferase Ste14